MKAFVFTTSGQESLKDVQNPSVVEPYGALLQPILIAPCSTYSADSFRGILKSASMGKV